jgi:antitoxin CcdA
MADLFDAGSPRKATNVTLNADLLAKAKALGVNLSRACERGLAEEVARAHAKAWSEKNADAIRAANEFVDRHGLPLARLRQF